MERELIRLEEACLFMGISKSQMYKLTSSKKIKHYKPNGKVIYFKIEDLVKFIETSEVMSNDQINQILYKKYTK